MGARYLNDEQKKHFREARNKTMLEKYGVKSFTNIEKVKSTKKERYGSEGYCNVEKRRQTCLERYGVDHQNKCPEIAEKIRKKKLSKEIQEKYENTILERYGTTNVNLVPEIREKRLSTLRKNKSFNKSKPEEDLYESLIEQYGEDNVKRQYKDERYPFQCDFYIPSEDLFIELNKFWHHGPHPFDPNNKEDLELLEKWQEKAKTSKHFLAAIDTWTRRDVEKQECARKNKLNYKVIY